MLSLWLSLSLSTLELTVVFTIATLNGAGPVWIGVAFTAIFLARVVAHGWAGHKPSPFSV